MNNLFVVHAWSNDDSFIVGVFTDKDLAIKAANEFGAHGHEILICTPNKAIGVDSYQHGFLTNWR